MSLQANTSGFEDVFDQYGRMSSQHREQFNSSFAPKLNVSQIRTKLWENGYNSYDNGNFLKVGKHGTRFYTYYWRSGNWTRRGMGTRHGGLDKFIEFLDERFEKVL